MRDFFFQIVLFLAAAVIGIFVPLLTQKSQKRIAGSLAALLLLVAILWTGYEIGAKDSSPTPPNPTSVAAVDTEAVQKPTSTFTFQPTNTDAPASPTVTDTPQPANTSTPRPTATTAPTNTPIPDTPPGTILNVGEEWRQNGVGLRLTEFNLNPGDSFYYGVNARFLFRNYTDSDLILTYADRDFLASTGGGRSLTVRGFYNRSFWCPETNVVVPANQSFDLDNSCDSTVDGYRLNIEVDFSDQSVTEVIVHVTQFSRITEARWRIPLNR